MPDYLRLGHLIQIVPSGIPLLVFGPRIKYPVISTHSCEVVRDYPSHSFLWVPPFCPSDESHYQIMVKIFEHLLTDTMSVVVSPASQDWVQVSYHHLCWDALMFPEPFFDFSLFGQNLFLLWFRQALLSLAANLGSQEVKALFYVSNVGLLFVDL